MAFKDNNADLREKFPLIHRIRASLFAAQSEDRIHARGASGRKIARRDANDRKENGYGQERYGIGRADAV
jgi:hypothetical protein